MPNVFVKIGMVLVFFEAILTVIGLMKPNWISACIPFNGFVGVMKNVDFEFQTDEKSSYYPRFDESQVCVHIGLFQVSFQVYRFDFTIFQPFQSVSYEMQGIIACIFAGNFLSVASVIFIAYQLYFAISSPHTRLCIFKFCIGLHFLGCITSGFGIIFYTIHQSSFGHSSIHFLSEVIRVVVQALPTGDLSDLDGNGHAVEENLGDYAFGLEADEKRALSVFRNLEPDFGFAFFLVWLAFGFAFSSTAALGFGYLNVRKCDILRPSISKPVSI